MLHQTFMETRGKATTELQAMRFPSSGTQAGTQASFQNQRRLGPGPVPASGPRAGRAGPASQPPPTILHIQRKEAILRAKYSKMISKYTARIYYTIIKTVIL